MAQMAQINNVGTPGHSCGVPHVTFANHHFLQGIQQRNCTFRKPTMFVFWGVLADDAYACLAMLHGRASTSAVRTKLDADCLLQA